MCGTLGQGKEQGYVQKEQRDRIFVEEWGGSPSVRGLWVTGGREFGLSPPLSPRFRAQIPGFSHPLANRGGAGKEHSTPAIGRRSTAADASGRAPL